MTKELVTMEFRYTDAPKDGYLGDHKTKTITIGVCDTLEEAIFKGNAAIEILESKFPLHKFPDGRSAQKERFSKNGGCFGYPNKLVTNMAYLTTPFEFYAKITTLKYDDIEQSITDVLESVKRYRAFKALNQG